jgi:copper transport protein
MSVRRSVTAITYRPLLARVTLALLLFLALLAARAPSASGHAAFLDSSPHAGARLGSGPPQIVLRFTEPLNRSLSKATLANATTGESIPAAFAPTRRNDQLALRPGRRLARAPYRVNWHTVSTVDGHALEGSFSFGVRTAASDSEHQIEQSPLARGGWLRIGFRALLYASLLFFAGGLINAALLARREPAGWLVPENLRSSLARATGDANRLVDRVRNWTLDAGWLAAGAASATALIEAADAGGSLSLQNASDFLLTNEAGLARVGTVVAVLLALLCAFRLPLVAATCTALAFLTIAFSGHANSAEPRLLAVATDWIHLLGAAVWIGGIAQIALAWLPVIRKADRPLRSEVMRSVLKRFGKVALPAFLVVAGTGLVNALIELGEVKALWESSYGRVLAVKIGLVGLIAIASYLHALRLRPRLLGVNPHSAEGVERRHWRLLSAEPLLAVAVVGVAATLVAFPLPPRQFGDVADAEPVAVCDPCPLPAPGPEELAVADQAGSRIAAFWLRHEGTRLNGILRLLDAEAKPVNAPVRIAGAESDSCGAGCWRFSLAGSAGAVSAVIEEKGKHYRASVPAAWQRDGSSDAKRLLARAQSTMRRLRTMREEERLTSGPGTFVRTRYRLKAPHRFSYETSSGARSIVIGKRQWTRTRGDPWQAQRFGGLSAFRTKGFFRWTPYARAARLLRVYASRGRRFAEVALFDPATPVWFRLQIELTTGRVLKDRMITKAHFMDRRYFAFNEPIEIVPPSAGVPAK